jgi:hypothetical protein
MIRDFLCADCKKLKPKEQLACLRGMGRKPICDDCAVLEKVKPKRWKRK